MKNAVKGLLQEYIKNNEIGDISQMTIGELTIFVAGFLKSFEESVEHALAEMKISDLASLQKVACDCEQTNQTPQKWSRNDRQAMLDHLAYARKCRLEKLAKRKEEESKNETSHKRGRRAKDFKPLKLYKRRPRKENEGCETYAVYDRCDGKRVNIMYAHVPTNLEKGRNVLKRSYAMETGVNYLNVSCRRLDNRKDKKMSQNVNRY